MRKLKMLGTAVLVGAVLLVCADYTATAATGQSFLLGKVNRAGTVTTLARTTDGAALKLTTKSDGNAALVTNGHGKVTNLNADRVDGRHASAFAPAAHGAIAAGEIKNAGTLGASWGVATSYWDGAPTHGYYVITLKGRTFDQTTFAVFVTQVDSFADPAMASYSSDTSGNLLVKFRDTAGTSVQRIFCFVVYALA